MQLRKDYILLIIAQWHILGGGQSSRNTKVSQKYKCCTSYSGSFSLCSKLLARHNWTGWVFSIWV